MRRTPTMESANVFLAAALGCALIPSGAQGVEFRVTERLTVKQGLEVSTSATASPLLFISSTAGAGNVGIGTTGPGEKLEVVGGLIKIPRATATDNDSPGITVISNDDFLYDGEYINHYGLGWHDYNDGAGLGVNAYLSGYYGLDLFTGGQGRLRINTNGNVGIGTPSPGAKLDVAGHQLFSVAGASITFNAGGPTIGVPAGNTLAFGTSGIERMRLDSLGRLGIGTTVPATKLDVDGNITQSVTHGDNMKLWLSAARNGGASGEVGLYSWISEPGMTWTGGGIARNMYNTTGFPRINTGLSGQMLRFTETGNVEFTLETSAGVRTVPLTVTPTNVGIGTISPASNLHVSGDLIRTIAYAQGSGIDTTCDVDTACGPSALAARTLAFTKKAVSTKVRVEYTDTMRSYGGTGARCCYWEVRFNGLSCPGGAIRGLVYSAADDPHRARIVKGYCSGLASGAHTVQVYVGSCSGLGSRCYTGWDGSATWVLDAEEVN